MGPTIGAQTKGTVMMMMIMTIMMRMRIMVMMVMIIMNAIDMMIKTSSQEESKVSKRCISEDLKRICWQ